MTATALAAIPRPRTVARTSLDRSPVAADAVQRPCLATPGLVHAGYCDCFRGGRNAPWRP